MEYLSWIAFAFTVAGTILSAKKNRWCWVVWIAGNVPWACYSYHAGQWAMLAQTAIFFCLNIYGLRQWLKGAV